MKRPVLPALYAALFDISQLRDQLGVMRDDLGDVDAARVLSRLDSAEQTALRLLEQAETRLKLVAH
jgi:hypothetical protein